ncbi:hypothetical protein [Nocardia wallacei]|uniref:hypothetical protein n=1 Tax=Nocardia wallacei TaxID=480035 RepID=UPI00245642CF|nr:hypothetical protein [Nocardia wallacei]
MTENVSTTTKYAIQLPNGKLSNDLPGDVRAGYPSSEILPNGDHVYVWRAGDLHNARNTIRNIAQTMKVWGTQELFEQQARVVTVRITAEILDGIFDNDEVPDAEMATDEPRRWDRVTDIPVDVRFHLGDRDNVYKRRDDDCLHLRSGAMYEFARFPSKPGGFVEVFDS